MHQKIRGCNQIRGKNDDKKQLAKLSMLSCSPKVFKVFVLKKNTRVAKIDVSLRPFYDLDSTNNDL